VTGDAVKVVGGGFPGLARAARLVRDGTPVDYVEPALHAGGLMRTESFLTPFRFNLGPSLVLRDIVGAARTLEPDPLVSVAGSSLGRDPVLLDPAGTAVEALAESGSERAPLLGLALLGGIDPQADGSGRELVWMARRLPSLVALADGNGLVAARLVDEIVASGGHVMEGLGTKARRRQPKGRLGTSRLFIGLRGAPPATPGFATAVGWRDDAELLASLDRLRGGEVSSPLGLLLRNAHLDPPGGGLSSCVWQGILPAGTALDRKAHTDSVLQAIGVDRERVLFSLLWLPEETGELLGARSSLRPVRV
jgi:hypothetical protein